MKASKTFSSLYSYVESSTLTIRVLTTEREKRVESFYLFLITSFVVNNWVQRKVFVETMKYSFKQDQNHSYRLNSLGDIEMLIF